MSHEKMVDRIQALIAKAEGTDNVAERETYFAKADELMQKYAIDAAMLSAAKKLNGGKVEEPEKVLFQFGAQGEDAIGQWYNLVIAVSEHFDCKFFGWSSGSGYLFGFPSNIEMAQMLYTSLRLHGLSKMDPKPNKDLSFEQNIHDLHEAGLRWKTIAQLMDQAWHEAKELGIPLADNWVEIGWDEKRKDGGRLIRACKAWAKAIGEPYRATSSPILFRRSYAQGFLNEVRDRLSILQAYKEQQVQATTGAALVLFDRNKLVDDMFELYKQLNGIKDRRSSVRIQGDAYDRGRAEGRRADLGQTRVGTERKGIGR